jgi:hypothetical protein
MTEADKADLTERWQAIGRFIDVACVIDVGQVVGSDVSFLHRN